MKRWSRRPLPRCRPVTWRNAGRRSGRSSASWAIRAELAGLVRDDRVAARLRAEGFGTVAPGAGPGREALATTIAGLYPTLRGLYQRMGEGRVDAVRAVVRAEAGARDLGGVIVFDRATRVRWREPVPDPGYAGVAGLFAGLLDEPGGLPMGVVSGRSTCPCCPADRRPALSRPSSATG